MSAPTQNQTRQDQHPRTYNRQKYRIPKKHESTPTDLREPQQEYIIAKAINQAILAKQIKVLANITICYRNKKLAITTRQ